MTTPNTLPPGTRYTVNGAEYELLEPSTRRPDGTYPAVRRRSADGEHDAPVRAMVDCQSLDLREGVTLPECPKLDPYAEHRRKIGDDL